MAPAGDRDFPGLIINPGSVGSLDLESPLVEFWDNVDKWKELATGLDWMVN